MVQFEEYTTAVGRVEDRVARATDRRASRVPVVDGPVAPRVTPRVAKLELRGVVTRSMELDGVVFVHQRLREPSPGVPPAALLQHFPAGVDAWDPTQLGSTSEVRELILIEHLEAGASADADGSDLQCVARQCVDFIGALGLADLDLLGFCLGVRPRADVVLLSSRLVRRLVAASQGAWPRPPADDPTEATGDILMPASRSMHPMTGASRD